MVEEEDRVEGGVEEGGGCEVRVKCSLRGVPLSPISLL